jgi:N6-adenosine-specific RNA methylase IME4
VVPCKVLSADPPWRFSDKLPGAGRGADKHYGTLSIAEICAFPLPPLDDNAVLFLWRVSSMVEEAYQVARSWGFVPKSELVWVKAQVHAADEDPKPQMGMGRIVRGAHETCIVATRGRVQPVDKAVRTVFFAPRTKHSAKPDEFFQIVERLFPLQEAGAHVELFSRQQRWGWACYGNELDEPHP